MQRPSEINNQVLLGLGLLLLSLACLSAEAPPGEQEYFEPGIELPAGKGRDLILRACTRCHTLEGVPAYSKYWGYERWLPMVENMVKHGAKLDEEEKVIVTRYLARHYGTD